MFRQIATTWLTRLEQCLAWPQEERTENPAQSQKATAVCLKNLSPVNCCQEGKDGVKIETIAGHTGEPALKNPLLKTTIGNFNKTLWHHF
jgi:hypothetical protein